MLGYKRFYPLITLISLERVSLRCGSSQAFATACALKLVKCL